MTRSALLGTTLPCLALSLLAATTGLAAQPDVSATPERVEVRVAPLADTVVRKSAGAKYAGIHDDGKWLSIGGWSSEVVGPSGAPSAGCRMQMVEQELNSPDGLRQVVLRSETVCGDVPADERIDTVTGDRWSFLKFDTGAAAHVSSARLRLFGARKAKSEVDMWADVVPAADTSWTEDELNLQFDTRDVLDRVQLARDEKERWYEWDVSDWVVREKAAGRHVVTLVVLSDIRLAAPISTDVGASFHSREAKTNQPEIVLTP